MMIPDSGLLFRATLYSRMSYVSGEIHKRQYRCTVFTSFRCSLIVTLPIVRCSAECRRTGKCASFIFF